MDKTRPLGVKILIVLFSLEALSRAAALLFFLTNTPFSSCTYYEAGALIGILIVLVLSVSIVAGLFKLKRWSLNLCIAGLVLEALAFSAGFARGFSKGIGSEEVLTGIISFSIVFLLALVAVFFIGRYLHSQRIKSNFD
ncbi:MAG: hypothetical protein GF375_05680 [Candidatus Omnitrophica bacterium]|nr:hypothetical protein [Candidatus Omnitrophota bacterium]MBD3269473.1 hypothetical protein [Candidatus Omnitrophota bacterium]